MITPKFSDIDWDIAEMACPPEGIFRDVFMQAGLWNLYNKQIGEKPDISFKESVDIAKILWRQYCHYEGKRERKEVKIEDKSVEMCEVVHTHTEPVISMTVGFPGGGGTEVLISRNEILHMLDALNGEW